MPTPPPVFVLVTADGARRILGPRESCLPCLKRFSGARVQAFPSHETAQQFCDEAAADTSPTSATVMPMASATVMPMASATAEGDAAGSDDSLAEVEYAPDPRNSAFATLEGPEGERCLIRVDEALRRFLKAGRYIYRFA